MFNIFGFYGTAIYNVDSVLSENAIYVFIVCF